MKLHALAGVAPSALSALSASQPCRRLTAAPIRCMPLVPLRRAAVLPVQWRRFSLSSSPLKTSVVVASAFRVPDAAAAVVSFPAVAICGACAPGPLFFALGAAVAALADAVLAAVAAFVARAAAAWPLLLFFAVAAGWASRGVGAFSSSSSSASRLSESRRLREALAEHSETLAGIERGISILYGHVDNVSHAQLETARRAAVLRADVDAALDALLGPGAAAELRAASAGAASAARRARLSEADSTARLVRLTGAYAGVLCSAILLSKVAGSVVGGKDEEKRAATAKVQLLLPAPKTATKSAVPFASSSSSSSAASPSSFASPSTSSTSLTPAPLSSAQERWAAAAANAAFGHGALASSTFSSSSIVEFSSAEERRRNSRSSADADAAEGEHETSEECSEADSSTTAAAFAFLGVLPFGLLPFLRRGQ